MLRTKNIITSFNEVDETLMFEFYLRPFGLTEKLEGQSVNLHSPFKKEQTPSFFLFHETRYFFKCFASNISGDVYTLVQHLFRLPNKAEAINKVWNQFEEYLNGTGGTYTINEYSNVQYTKKIRYHVKNVELRKWNTLDKDFWYNRYGINRDILDYYNVGPLDKIIMNKVEHTGVSEFEIKNPLSYAYFDKRGQLNMIYQVGKKRGKFLKVRSHIQGADQIKKRENLLITKSLKDVMEAEVLKLETYDRIAPDSENTLIPKETMDQYKKDYKHVAVLFDPDETGRRNASLYKEKYNVDVIELGLSEKDLTDNVEKYGPEIVKNALEKALELNKEKVC